VSEPKPWQCPSCSAWLAPHVSEHRCDPPAAGVTVTYPGTSGPAGSTGMSISTATLPGTVTVSVTGPVINEQELARTVQNGMLRLAANNARVRRGLSGRAA
jgi:hypothetical protein